MAGSDNFAPVGISGSGQIPLSMVAEQSPVMSPRLTLDHSSFEKLLSAAWVLQCLHDQLHNQEIGRGETIADLVETPEPLQTTNSGLPAAVQTVAQPSPGVTCSESTLDVRSARGAGDRVLAEFVVQQSAENRILSIEAPLKVELKTVEPGTSLRPENEFTLHPSRPPLAVLEKVANDDNKKRSRFRPEFNFYAVKLQAAFSRGLDAFIKLGPALRVNLNLRAVRAAAIATPVLVLTLIAASLLLEAWRREPSNNAQAISRSSAPTATAAVNDVPTTQATTKRAASDDGHKRVPHRKPNRASAIPPPRSSHRQVTDPAALSAVRRLSRYEIRGLRRQAKYGDASAAFTLGMAYEVGRDVPQNCAEAARWVTTAAEAGDAAAEYNLGLRYRDGDGVAANRAESAKWLRKAAARRYANANLALKMLASR
jgi:hypothetical protein